MPSLHRTVPFSQIDRISCTICQNLYLHMLWSGQKMLQIHCSISKGLFCFCLCYLEIFSELLRALCHTHPLSAASKGSLDHDRISDRFCLLQSIFFLINSIPAARNNRNSCFLHRISGFLLIPHSCDYLCRRTDKNNPTFFTQLCKPAVL